MVKKFHSIAQIDEAELTVRIAEACFNMNRPDGMSAEDVLNGMENSTDPMQINVVNDMKRAARACLLYFKECIEGAERVQ